MNEIQLQYKRETGNYAQLYVESELLIQPLDFVQIQEMTKKEIISCIKFEQPGKWGVLLENFPAKFKDCDDDLVLPNAEYIEWLEEKVESLQKEISNNQ